ncbi:MAG: PilT/PilU family type 4a pilus ATPase [Candidatus Shapirobacteria bacterium]
MEKDIKAYLDKLLELTINNMASDLHLVAGYPPVVRVYGELYPLANEPAIEEERLGRLIELLLSQRKERFLKEKEVDFSFIHSDGQFRVNVYFQQGQASASLRYLAGEVPSLNKLGLPSLLSQVVNWRQGLVLITGPTGHGKSTTVASLLEEINSSRRAHIISVEDPIEYRFRPNKSIISQREVGADTKDWSRALRSSLRQDPDVVFIGEMRDLETIGAALTIAETGHLVFSTLHTNSAAETVDRIIDVFPGSAKQQVTSQLAAVLGMVISQRLVPGLRPGRVPALEILINNPAVKNAIREGKSYMIDNIIQTSNDTGMVLLEKSLIQLVKENKIAAETARDFAIRKSELNRYFRK